VPPPPSRGAVAARFSCCLRLRNSSRVCLLGLHVSVRAEYDPVRNGSYHPASTVAPECGPSYLGPATVLTTHISACPPDCARTLPPHVLRQHASHTKGNDVSLLHPVRHACTHPVLGLLLLFARSPGYSGTLHGQPSQRWPARTPTCTCRGLTTTALGLLIVRAFRAEAPVVRAATQSGAGGGDGVRAALQPVVRLAPHHWCELLWRRLVAGGSCCTVRVTCFLSFCA
jgi:hypothetical protein